MGEFSGNQVSHRNRTPGCPVAAGSCLGGLNQRVDAFHTSMTQVQCKSIEDADEVPLNGGRQFLHLGDPASVCTS